MDPQGELRGSKLPLTFPTRDYSHFSPAKIISKIGSNSATHLAFFSHGARESGHTELSGFSGLQYKWCHFLYTYFKFIIPLFAYK